MGTLPHNTSHFTQGLFFSNGYLYESTGRYDQSALYRLHAKTGAILDSRRFSAVFLEGSAALDGAIHLLTWQDKKRFTLREADLALLSAHELPGEGWGLCSDEEGLWMSDGTAELRRFIPDKENNWAEVERLRITDAGYAVFQLNELEWIDGLLYANVWQSDRIAVIDPAHKGQSNNCPVLFWLDCSAIAQAYRDTEADVLNGIAWDAKTRRLLITGKLWPVFHELELPQAPHPR